MTRLHLGCGQNVIDGWVNVDIESDDPRVVCSDVRNLDAVAADGSVERIYACHVLEHIPRADEVPALAHWRKKLVPGGACHVSVPDFGFLAARYHDAVANGEPWWTMPIIGSLMGGFPDGSHDEHNHHHSLFDFAFMVFLMGEAGFVGVRRYEPTEIGTDPGDHSLRDLSLNVVGFRPLDDGQPPGIAAAEATEAGEGDDVQAALDARGARTRARLSRVLGETGAALVLRLAHPLAMLVRPLRRYAARTSLKR